MISFPIDIVEFIVVDCRIIGVYVDIGNCCLSDLCILSSSSSSLRKVDN